MGDEPNKLADESTVEAEAAALVEDVAVSAELAETEVAEAEVVEAGDSEAGAAEVGVDDVLEEVAAEEAQDAVDEVAEEAIEEEVGEEVGKVDVAEQRDDAGDGDAGDGDASDDDIGDDDIGDDEGAEEAAAADSDEIKMDWYILKVQSNREKSITAALKRKIAVEGLEEYFGDVVVPVEKVTEFKGGKKKVVQRKLYPGYIVVHMHINDDTWFAVRETSGIGDFTGSGGKPTPMLPHEIARIIQTEEEESEDAPKLNISFTIGDQVKVNDGNFESFEGEVSAIDEHSGRITVMINIFGRSTPVELEYWQVEQT